MPRCSKCGEPLEKDDLFCMVCGSKAIPGLEASHTSTQTIKGGSDRYISSSGTKKLYRSKKDRVVLGVCGGIGEYLDIDPSIIRILFILVFFFSSGLPLLAYILFGLVIPEAPE